MQDRKKRSRTDVGMVDLGQKAHLWRRHGVLFWQEQLEAEHALCRTVISHIHAIPEINHALSKGLPSGP